MVPEGRSTRIHNECSIKSFISAIRTVLAAFPPEAFTHTRCIVYVPTRVHYIEWRALTFQIHERCAGVFGEGGYQKQFKTAGLGVK